MTRLQFSDLFGFYSEPIVGVKNGKITAFNTAAAKFYPGLDVGREASDFLPGMLFEGTERTAGAVEVMGREISAVAVTMGGMRIVTVMENMRKEDVSDSYYIPLSAASGELRNAISTMMLSSSLLDGCRAAEPENGRIENYLCLHRQSMYRIMRLTENMSDVFGSDALFDKKDAADFNITDTCTDMVTTVAHVAASRRISVEYEGTREIILFNGFEDRIEKMLLQVFSNSLKYTHDGGKIRLTLQKNPGGVIIKISDNGCGISADILPTVFTRYRERRDVHDPNAGIGLGLSIVNRIARIHEGAALLDSRVGKGTTVTIYLKNTAEPGLVLRADELFRKPRDMKTVLIQLSDAADYTLYRSEYMD